MGYRLQMSAEIYDWLAELRGSDQPTAVLAAQALAALATDGDRLGPPLVIAVAGRLRPDELSPALDRRYQAWLESMSVMRRRVADAVTLRKNIERQLAEVESPRVVRDEQHQPAPGAGRSEAVAQAADEVVEAAPDRAAGLREQLAAAIETEQRLAAASQREQMRVDAFRTRKEILKAAYTTARAEQLIEQAQEADAADVRPEDPVWPSAGAAARLDEITSQLERELGWEAPAEGLMELRPGAPAGSDIRILFAVEPPGAALLIAVLEGSGAVQDHYRQAVSLASGVLREARAGQVAARMGVRQERVSAIERAESGATEVRTLAGYVEALGGRLDIIADFGTERILLR